MFRGHTRGLRLMVCAGLMVLAGGAGAGWGAGPAATRVPTGGHRGAGGGVPTFTLQPVSSTGAHTIVGTEIILERGGVEVEFEVYASGWGDGDPTRLLNGVNAALNTEDWLGSNALPANPGVDLVLVSGYTARYACFVGGAICSGIGPSLQCPGSGNFCAHNPRFVLWMCPDCCWAIDPCLPWHSRPTFCIRTTAPLCGPVDPGPIADPADYGYCGTLVLEVPVNAIGTYTVGFVEDEFWTFLFTTDGMLFDGDELNTVPARITIADCNGNEVADAEDVASGTSADCNGNKVPDECEVDSDGDGVIDECDICSGSDDALDSDGDGVVDCVDLCPGVDDAIFAPGCVEAIPAASTWGVVVLALLLMGAGKVGFGRRAGVDKTTT